MSSNSVRDLRDTIVPKSDQLNADQLLGGPITITVTEVRRGSGDDQPVVVHYEGEGGRPFKPCKSMRKILLFAWGSDGNEWVGRSMTVFNQPDVKFGGEEVGGIRISHLSHIEKNIEVSLTTTRGKKAKTRIQRLDEGATVAGSRARLEAAARGGMTDLVAAWGAIPRDHKAQIGPQGCPDDLKAIATAADGKKAPTDPEPASTDQPAMAYVEVGAAIANAADMDALDAAYDAKGLVPDLTDVERKALHSAYEKRREELQQ